MDGTEAIEAGALSAGSQLRDARERAKLSLAEVAARTRIPQRHLEAIERDDFNALPSTTYSVGFARAFARTVGADEVAIAASVRAQLEQSGRERHAYQAFEPADPARVPPRSLAWVAALVAVLILAGYGIWRASWSSEDDAAPIVTAAPKATPRPARGPTPAAGPASGPVVLTATDEVWIKVTDASGKALVQKALKAGESYQVPADAQEPKLTFSRPEVLNVTVGGVALPPLGPPAKLVKNALLTPEGLRARAATATPTP
ncbi:helix-turn-helix domain-containing protein [Sphingomonas sp.]|jgi:cytoskeletal protein RodZ|uniref:helix-turn-helix domain-containing protein n=1 Tax=Sphingomonas sp. TaxID=28214 RepID=UPI002DEE5AA9|nr:RodZ domain-containing protein [Sphingomonas sp.]